MAEILLENDSGILVVRLNRAEKKNALTVSMYDALRRALLEAKDDPNVHVVVMQGRDEVFSAGNDMLDFLLSPPVDSSAPAWQFIRALSTFPKPLVAAVSGVAIGIGTTMLLHCDLVYASKGSRFGVPGRMRGRRIELPASKGYGLSRLYNAASPCACRKAAFSAC